MVDGVITIATIGSRGCRLPRARRVERARQFSSGADAEFGVAAGEVCFDGTGGNEQQLSDLAVGASFGGEPSDAQLAGREGVATVLPAAAATQTATEFGFQGPPFCTTGRSCELRTTAGSYT